MRDQPSCKRCMHLGIIGRLKVGLLLMLSKVSGARGFRCKFCGHEWLVGSEDGFTGHLFEYQMDGANWAITVIAASEADARRRLSLAAGGRLLGTHVETVPAIPGAGMWVRFWTWMRNRR